jgi:hypothetical protein
VPGANIAGLCLNEITAPKRQRQDLIFDWRFEVEALPYMVNTLKTHKVVKPNICRCTKHNEDFKYECYMTHTDVNIVKPRSVVKVYTNST